MGINSVFKGLSITNTFVDPR